MAKAFFKISFSSLTPHSPAASGEYPPQEASYVPSQQRHAPYQLDICLPTDKVHSDNIQIPGNVPHRTFTLVHQPNGLILEILIKVPAYPSTHDTPPNLVFYN